MEQTWSSYVTLDGSFKKSLFKKSHLFATYHEQVVLMKIHVLCQFFVKFFVCLSTHIIS